MENLKDDLILNKKEQSITQTPTEDKSLLGGLKEFAVENDNI